MLNGNSIERVQMWNRIFSRACFFLGKAITLLALFGLLVGGNRGFGQETPVTEYQVKALFLLNFAKYVEWPSNSFAATDAPVVIGVIGGGKMGSELAKTVEGKTVGGHPVLIRQIQTPADSDTCHILFLAASEKARLVEILNRTRTKPVLTVGETEKFMEQGGAINFVKRESKVRLEINLDATRQANLQVSSKLLSVADVVKGKAK